MCDILLHMETGCPGMLSLEEDVAALLIPRSAGWAATRELQDMMEYFNKIVSELAADNLGVLEITASL